MNPPLSPWKLIYFQSCVAFYLLIVAAASVAVAADADATSPAVAADADATSSAAAAAFAALLRWPGV